VHKQKLKPDLLGGLQLLTASRARHSSKCSEQRFSSLDFLVLFTPNGREALLRFGSSREKYKQEKKKQRVRLFEQTSAFAST
jgi:hypothetical protein